MSFIIQPLKDASIPPIDIGNLGRKSILESINNNNILRVRKSPRDWESSSRYTLREKDDCLGSHSPLHCFETTDKLYSNGTVEDIITANTIFRNPISKLISNDSTYTYENLFRDDMKKFEDEIFDWRIEIRSNANNIQNRMKILAPFSKITDQNYPIELVNIDDSLKKILSVPLIFNYINNPYRDALSNSYRQIQEFYDLILNFFYTCHLVNDSINFDKIDTKKVMIIDPCSRQKIRNYNKAIMLKLYIFDNQNYLMDFIKLLLKFYYPNVSKHL